MILTIIIVTLLVWTGLSGYSYYQTYRNYQNSPNSVAVNKKLMRDHWRYGWKRTLGFIIGASLITYAVIAVIIFTIIGVISVLH